MGDRGQVTIPKRIREQEDIQCGAEEIIERKDGKIVIRKSKTAVADDDLARGYQEHADHARQLNDEWDGVSREANDHL